MDDKMDDKVVRGLQVLAPRVFKDARQAVKCSQQCMKSSLKKTKQEVEPGKNYKSGRRKSILLQAAATVVIMYTLLVASVSANIVTEDYDEDYTRFGTDYVLNDPPPLGEYVVEFCKQFVNPVNVVKYTVGLQDESRGGR